MSVHGDNGHGTYGGGSIVISTSELHLEDFHLDQAQIIHALHEGGKVIMDDAKRRCPTDDGDYRRPAGYLRDSGSVKDDRGGNSTIGLKFDGPYAHWIHEHMWFKHPHGGQAKFLETAMVVKGGEAINRVGREIRRELGI